MDKRKIAALCIASFLLAPTKAAAAEVCQITAPSQKTLPEKTVTVPVSIAGNPGFTNFAIALEYDTDKLELTGIQTATGDVQYLCGGNVSTNTAWKTSGGKACGFIAAASGKNIGGDGTLFTATFLVKVGATGTAVITPRVQYLRSFSDTFSDMDVTVQQAEITVIAYGDITMDGKIEYDDVILAYQAAIGETTLTAEQVEIADLAEEDTGSIDMADVQAIYDLYTGGE